jgi:hypothetical protein
MTLEQVASLPIPDVPNYGRRASWPEETRKEIDRIESQGVLVEGYLTNARAVGPTAANARRQDPKGRDWAFSLLSNPNDGISKSITALISPRVRSAHPEWDFARLRELSQSSQKVRVSGWLLFGSPRWMNLGRGATRWRIHPVLNVED